LIVNKKVPPGPQRPPKLSKRRILKAFDKAFKLKYELDKINPLQQQGPKNPPFVPLVVRKAVAAWRDHFRAAMDCSTLGGYKGQTIKQLDIYMDVLRLSTVVYTTLSGRMTGTAQNPIAGGGGPARPVCGRYLAPAGVDGGQF